MVNAEYKTHGIDKVVSCKTLKAQLDIAAEAGDNDLADFFDREPQDHLGPALAYKTKKSLKKMVMIKKISTIPWTKFIK